MDNLHYAKKRRLQYITHKHYPNLTNAVLSIDNIFLRFTHTDLNKSAIGQDFKESRHSKYGGLKKLRTDNGIYVVSNFRHVRILGTTLCERMNHDRPICDQLDDLLLDFCKNYAFGILPDKTKLGIELALDLPIDDSYYPNGRRLQKSNACKSWSSDTWKLYRKTRCDRFELLQTMDDIAILNISNIKDVYRSNRDYWNGKMASAILRAKKKGKFLLDVDVSDRQQTNRKYLMDEIDKLPIKVKRYRQN